MAVKVIIDTDPGIDDAMAIHYAFAHSGLEVLALTTVFGNVWVEQATRNVLFLAEQAGSSAVVAEGAGRPMEMAANAPSHHVHGSEGFGALGAVRPRGVADSRPAHEVISELCREHPGEVVLVAVGPLTNIAQALAFDPEIVSYVQRLVIMGGAVYCGGNVSRYAEANIWNDPHAADLVFGADWSIDLIGLDVTQKIRCCAEDFAGIVRHAPKIGGFLHEISDFYIQFYHSVVGDYVCLMHDPSAVVSVTEPELFTYEALALEVITEGAAIGRTVVSEAGASGKGRRGVRVAVGVDSAGVIERFVDICSKSDTIAEKRFIGANGKRLI